MSRPWITRLLVLLLLGTSATSLHILVYTATCGHSHSSFAVALIDKLVQHGHTVDFVVARLNPGTPFDPAKTAARRSFVVDNDPANWALAAKHAYSPFKVGRPWNPFITFINKLTGQFRSTCAKVLESPVIAELNSTNYDFAMASNFDSCPFGVFHALGIRRYALFSALPSFPLSSFAAGLPDLPIYTNSVNERNIPFSKESLIGRTADLLHSFLIRATFAQGYDDYLQLFRSRFGPQFPPLPEILRNASFDFANAHPLLDEARPTSSKMKNIGGIALRTPKKLDGRFESILQLRKQTVIFSFGNMVPAQFVPTNVREAFLTAFTSFPDTTFLWKLENTTFPDAPNIATVDFLPQTDLLYDERVVGFISHLGRNSYIEAALSGTPMLALPLQIDQGYNANQAVRLGTAIMLDKGALTAENIKSALEQLLHNESYRSNAKELAGMLADWPEDPERTLIEAVEYGAKYDDLHAHLTPLGARHSMFVHHGYDAFIFLILLASSMIVFVLTALYGIARLVLRFMPIPQKIKTA